MPFLIFVDNCDSREWGFISDFVPAVGDQVSLVHALADKGYPRGIVDARVVGRTFEPGLRLVGNKKTVHIDVELSQRLPTGHVAHSDQWPATSYSERLERRKAVGKILRLCREKDKPA